MKKILVMLLVYSALAVLSGCGPWQLTECIEMTDGGVMGRHFDAWQKDDERIRADFKPQIKSWSKFRRTCLNAADCYQESLEIEERRAHAATAQEH